MMEYDVQGYLANALGDYCHAIGITVDKMPSKPIPFNGQPLERDRNDPRHKPPLAAETVAEAEEKEQWGDDGRVGNVRANEDLTRSSLCQA